MKKMTTILLMSLSLGTFANTELELFNKSAGEGANYFELLEELFEDGAKPDPMKLDGIMWSGRCFEKDNPSKPINGAYLLKRAKSYSTSVQYEALSIWSKELLPSHYDDTDISVFDNYRMHRVFEKENSLQHYVGKTTFSFRVSGNYLVEQIKKVKEDVGPIGQGPKVITMCYYFIPGYF